MLQREYQGVRWQLLPEFEPLLAAVLEDTGETVKQSFVTLVTRHRVAGRVFYVKRYRYEARPLSPVKYFVRSPKSRREWRHAPLLQQRGIGVVPHLAHGERWGWRGLLQSTLITEGMESYEALSAVRDPASADLQFALGRFLRRIHDAGVLYLDISAKNVLYSPVDHAFCLLDVDKVAMASRQDAPQRVDNLIFFCSYFPLTGKFFEGYGDDLVGADQIRQRAEALRRARLAKWAGRCLKHKHEVITKRLGGLKWHIRLAHLDARLENVLQDPARHLGNASGFVVQKLRFRSAREAYRQAYHRELLGDAATPQPVAAAERRILGIVWHGWLVTLPP
jgi:tRNA A-37 threonylcarbamoyl transferase component Bud32